MRIIDLIPYGTIHHTQEYKHYTHGTLGKREIVIEFNLIFQQPKTESNMYASIKNFSLEIQEMLEKTTPSPVQQFAAKMPNIFAASALSYTTSLLRLEHGQGTYTKEETYSFSSVKDDEIENYIEEQDFIRVVSNATRINARSGYLFFGEKYPVLGVNITHNKSSATLEVFGYKPRVLQFHADFKARFPNNTFEVHQVDSIGQNGVNQRTRKVEMQDINIQTKEFYPWFESEFDTYYKEYFESSKNVLLVIGSAGGGKTTYVRNMLKAYGKETMIANNASLFDDSRLFEHFASSDAELLLIEDADNAVMPRSEGNMGMSYLLNLSDGIIPLKKKIVIVTNLPSISNVDPALIRPGRCHDILEFRKLTAVEAMAARKSIGMEYHDLAGVQKDWSLAEALNYDLDLKIQQRKKVSIGFN